MRDFTQWSRVRKLEKHRLPPEIHKVTGQRQVDFGDCIIKASDTTIGMRRAARNFLTPAGPHIAMGLDGAEICTISSVSHHELRKLNKTLSLILEATRSSGGVYLYLNQQGCDGDRLYYDGCAMIVVNGEIKAQGSHFGLN